MKAPLRRVTKRELRHTWTSMSKRGSTITVTNHYNTSFTLECGHRIEVTGSCAPEVANKRCKRCLTPAVNS